MKKCYKIRNIKSIENAFYYRLCVFAGRNYAVKVEMNADDLMAFSEKALLIYCKFKWIMRVCRFRFRIGGRNNKKLTF